MNVLVVGGGGREHALVWKLSQSRQVRQIHVAPGNAGMAGLAACHRVAATDIPGQVRLARDLAVDFVVVAPDDPLALGLVDALEAEGIPAFGPRAAAARIESSKGFAKEIMAAAGVPTARAAVFSDYCAAADYVRSQPGPVVVKADGLALGKGVVVCDNQEQALAALREMMIEGRFGAAGERVLVEERLEGQECTLLALTDGKRFLAFPPSQDHKRIGEADTGPNTGGMGAYSPVPAYTPEVDRAVAEQVIGPTLEEMARRGHPFRGCLYVGLMLTRTGPKVIEFNARFGDPEAQVVVPLLDGDMLELMQLCARGDLAGIDRLPLRPGASACVVIASAGYPGPVEKGKPIHGLEQAVGTGALVFHAGTAAADGQVVTAGGRVLGIVGRGPDLRTALDQAYAGVREIAFDGMYYRRDIGWRAVQVQG